MSNDQSANVVWLPVDQHFPYRKKSPYLTLVTIYIFHLFNRLYCLLIFALIHLLCLF